MNVDQLLLTVADLSMLNSKELLEHRLSECQAAYQELNAVRAELGKAELDKVKALLSAIARIQNKIAAIKYSERREAQRALRAAATIPLETFSSTGARAHP